jgi:hypothetical protein
MAAKLISRRSDPKFVAGALFKKVQKAPDPEDRQGLTQVRAVLAAPHRIPLLG